MWVGMSYKLYSRPFETTILIWKMIHSWSLAYSWCQLLREIYHCIRKMKFLKVDRIFSGSLRLPTRESSDGNDFSNWSSKVPQTVFLFIIVYPQTWNLSPSKNALLCLGWLKWNKGSNIRQAKIRVQLALWIKEVAWRPLACLLGSLKFDRRDLASESLSYLQF